jgi:hypothetical protein
MALQPEVLFIDENYIKKYTWINGSVDPLMLYPAIYLAQDEKIQQYLGTDLYYKIKDDLEANTISGNYLLLLDRYIRRATCWWAMYEVLPHLWVKTDNGSLVQRTSEDTTSISTDAYEKYREQTRQKALFFTARMVDYLCYNQSLFPEYLTNVQNQMWSDTNVFPSNNFEISSGNDRITRNYKRGINGELYG